jgi:outer membrane protein assembly factor BamB
MSQPPLPAWPAPGGAVPPSHGDDSVVRPTRRRWGLAIAGVLTVVLAAGAFGVLRQHGPAWRVEDGVGDSNLVADDDTVCGVNLDDEAFCLDAANGHELFRTRLGEHARALSLDDGVLLVRHNVTDTEVTDTEVPDTEARLQAYSRDGRKLWTNSRDLRSYDPDPPVVDGVVLLESSHPAAIQAVDVATGNKRWEAPMDPPGSTPRSVLWSVPRTDGRSVYVSVAEEGNGSTVSRLVALDPATGDERWRAAIGEIAEYGRRPPYVQDAASLGDSTTAFVVGELERDRQLLVVDTTGGETVWEEPLGDLPAVVAGIDGMVVVLSGDELRSYDAGDGTPVWTEAVSVVDATPNQALVRSGNLLVTRGQLYLHTDGVWTVDPRTGETEPIATDGVLAVAVTRDYVVTAKGCCLEAQPPPD